MATVPDKPPTATFPKFMSTVLVIVSGATIVAVAVADAVAVAWAKAPAVKPSIRIAANKSFFIFFVLSIKLIIN
jgi:hypothetical protein